MSIIESAKQLDTDAALLIGRAGGQTLDGSTLTTETLSLRNNAVDDLGVDIEADGVLHVNAVNYEALVTDDDDVPNKKYVDDAAGTVVAKQEILTVSSPGQTAFTLAKTPSGTDSFGIFLNGNKQPTTAYSFVGTSLTWGGTPSLLITDRFEAWYDWQAPSPGLSLGTHAGTLPVAGANLVVTAATLGLADARQIVMSQLMGRATDQNWYFAGNTWGGATHNFNYTIPTLADPNVGDLVIQVAGTSSSVASQPFELIYYYQATNFLS